ncbi:MAG: PD40 domain-containing protein [Sedimentisphaerales bacterium]|nr:PD40 domain-containing protein [Sedimentisphaerales bacterium]
MKSLIRAACQGRSGRSEWSAADERIVSHGAEAMRQAYNDSQRVTHWDVWRRIMENRRTRFALVAVLAIAILLPLSYGATKLIRRFAAISELPPIEADFAELGALSPDGKHFAVVTGNNELVVIDTATGEQRKIATGCAGTVVWSADGSEIAVQKRDEVQEQPRVAAISSTTGETRTLSPRPGGIADWSPDGKYLLGVRSRANVPSFRVVIFNVETDERIIVANETVVWPYPAFSPNGRWVSYVAKQDGRSVLHLQEIGGPGHASFSDFRGNISRPLWSPDGSHIVFTGTQSGIDLEFKDLWALRIEGNRFVGAAFPVMPDIEQMEFCNWSRNGQLAYRTGFRLGGMFTLPVDPQTGKAAGAPRQLVRRPGLGSFCWSPDGQQIAMRGPDGLNFISASSGEKLQSVSLPQIKGNNIGYGGRGMSWSPDGKWIALSGWEGGTRPGLFLSTPDGSEVRLLVPMEGNFAVNCDPTWSPDSKTIAYGNRNDIFVVSVESGEPQRVTPPSENQRSKSSNRPVFMPDGNSVAYLAGFGKNFGERLLATTIDGQETRQILSLEDKDFGINIFDLSPDGRYVVFTPGNAEIWCAPTDGGEPFRIADTSNVGSNAWAWMPRWSPKGDAIIFNVTCEQYRYWVMENVLPAR